jgi:hypothetical protein
VRHPELLLALPVFASAHRHRNILDLECFEQSKFSYFNHGLLWPDSRKLVVRFACPNTRTDVTCALESGV